MPLFPNSHDFTIHGGTFANVGRDWNQTVVSGDYVVHNRVHKTLREFLSPIENSSFNRSSNNEYIPRCHKDTRKEVFATIFEWMDDPLGKPIFFLTGQSGSGKTAVCQTLCEMLVERGRLASSFFLCGAGGRNRFSGFIPTLAHELATCVPEVTPFIENAVCVDEAAPQGLISHQFRKVIVEPVMNMTEVMGKPGEPIIAVIDGLGECQDRSLIAEFLEIVVDVYQTRPDLPIRLLLSGCADFHIQQKLGGPASQPIVLHRSLDDFDNREDLRRMTADAVAQHTGVFANMGLHLPMFSPEEMDQAINHAFQLAPLYQATQRRQPRSS